jgi:hypothetical protein
MILTHFRRWFFSVVVAGAAMLCTDRAQAFYACNHSFNDHFGLSELDPSQAYGFAGPNGGIWYYSECTSTTDWFYFDEDPSNEGHFIDPAPYGHFHIPNEDPSVTDCFTNNSTYPKGVWGKMTNPPHQASCAALDPLVIDRYAFSHEPDQLLRFIDLGGGISPRPDWRPQYITVRSGSGAVRVTYLAANGVVWFFANLTPGRWYLNPPVGPGTGGVKAWVGTEPGTTTNFIVDDIVIDYTND